MKQEVAERLPMKENSIHLLYPLSKAIIHNQFLDKDNRDQVWEEDNKDREEEQLDNKEEELVYKNHKKE